MDFAIVSLVGLLAAGLLGVVMRRSIPFSTEPEMDVAIGLKVGVQYRVLKSFGLEEPGATPSAGTVMGETVTYLRREYAAHDGFSVFRFHRANGDLTSLLLFDGQPRTDVWLSIERVGDARTVAP